jgi:hypothetical protein
VTPEDRREATISTALLLLAVLACVLTFAASQC